MGQKATKQVSSSEAKAVVQTGVDCLAASNFAGLQNARVGVITNASGVFQNMKHLVDVLHETAEVDLVAIFGPEHGFRSSSEAGSSRNFYTDPRTKLPVYDTYQKSRKALSALFDQAEVDLLLFDIQDVGARFFTYIWTMYDCMVAAVLAHRDIKMIVADRPNPVGGCEVDGPVLKHPFSSFIGRKAIPLRHGMTVGELALLFNSEYVARDAGKEVDLEVVAMKGWDRKMLFSDTGLLWVSPSPNISSAESCIFYVGMALFEGLNCSEGRGTALPFQMIGAPWIDHRLVDHLQALECPGALFRETCFIPSSSKFSRSSVNGIQVHISDIKRFNPLRTAFMLIISLHTLYPNEFVWRKDGPTYWVDLLLGTDSIRKAINAGATADEVLASWQHDITWFDAMRQTYLLY